MTPERYIEALGLEPLEPEGGWWSQSHIDANGTGIHYLLTADQQSSLHQLPGPEIYFYQDGDPLDLLVLHPDGKAERVLIGPDIDGGHHLQFVVPGGCWQGSTSTGAFSLVGTAMAPAFRFEDYRGADRSELCTLYPNASDRIVELTEDNR